MLCRLIITSLIWIVTSVFSQSYNWPCQPFDQQHWINGTFCECRAGSAGNIDHFHDGVRSCEIEPFVPLRFEIGDTFGQGELHPLCWTGDELVPLDPMFADMIAHDLRALAATGVEAAVEIALVALAPIGLGMAQQAENFHACVFTEAASPLANARG